MRPGGVGHLLNVAEVLELLFYGPGRHLDLAGSHLGLARDLANAQRQVGVTYVSALPLQQGDPDQLALPRLRLAIAFRPIPEPGTAVLVAVGLIALALRRRVGS